MSANNISHSLIERLLDKKVLLNDEKHLLNVDQDTKDSKFGTLDNGSLDQNDLKKVRSKNERFKK